MTNATSSRRASERPHAGGVDELPPGYAGRACRELVCASLTRVDRGDRGPRDSQRLALGRREREIIRQSQPRSPSSIASMTSASSVHGITLKLPVTDGAGL